MVSSREVSINRKDRKKLSEIFSTVIMSKGLLFLCLSIVSVIAMIVLQDIYGYKTLFLLSLWACIYEVLFPEWFFQGIESMGMIALLTLIVRLVSLLLFFSLINAPTDYLLIPIINGAGGLLICFTSLAIMRIKFGVRFRNVSFSKIVSLYRDSFPIFMSKISLLYVRLNKVILGSFGSMSDVVVYDIAEKIVNSLKIPISMVGRAIFPKFAATRDRVFLNDFFKWSLLVNASLIIATMLFGSHLLSLFLPKENLESPKTLWILVLSLVPITFNVFLGNQLLFGSGYKNHYMKSIMIACIAYLVGTGILIYLDLASALWIATIVVLAEATTSFSSYFYCKKNNLL